MLPNWLHIRLCSNKGQFRLKGNSDREKSNASQIVQQKMDKKVPEKKRSRESNETEENEPIAKRLRSSHNK